MDPAAVSVRRQLRQQSRLAQAPHPDGIAAVLDEPMAIDQSACIPAGLIVRELRFRQAASAPGAMVSLRSRRTRLSHVSCVPWRAMRVGIGLRGWITGIRACADSASAGGLQAARVRTARGTRA